PYPTLFRSPPGPLCATGSASAIPPRSAWVPSVRVPLALPALSVNRHWQSQWHPDQDSSPVPPRRRVAPSVASATPLAPALSETWFHPLATSDRVGENRGREQGN